mmetsp:Transcript_14546/g.22597  ORF Transcript_14546/g.22597 Transcript_14546/m.22597 type:complete len:122 (-) Transcript_14546:75-440(-)
MTKKARCPVKYKIMLGLLFPNTATAKAGVIIAQFDYNPGGEGLTPGTLWQYVANFSVGYYFIIMIYGFFLQLGIGMLFRYYGSLPEILSSIKRAVTKQDLDSKETEVLKKLEQREQDLNLL